MLFSSCIKDEEMNQECDILSAWVEGDDDFKALFYQPETDMKIANVLSNDRHIIFTVRSTETIKEVPVFFNITPGATISPANGSKQDFSKGGVTYTVTSEDGRWHRSYVVDFCEPELPTSFNFENHELTEVSNLFFGKYSYYSWYENNSKGVRVPTTWTNGNEGFGMGNSSATAENFPTSVVENGFEGHCVKMVTCDAGALAQALHKPLAAGNMFLGKFDMGQVLTNPLASTLMGIPMSYNEVPVRITGYYKYKPGEKYIDQDLKEVQGKVDEADIYSVIYRNKDEQGNPVMLNGGDVKTSPYVMLKAEVASLPPTDEWTPFEMVFSGQQLDESLLRDRGYNFTIVFSSSKDGASFLGAIGSTLYVDKVEVHF